MVVINELDEKINLYQRKKTEAINLRKRIDSFKQEIVEMEDLIQNSIQDANEINSEKIASIQMKDLLEQVSFLTGIKKENLEAEIIVSSMIFDDKKDELVDNIGKNSLNSRLRIKDKSGLVICNQELSLFDSLDQIQADERILLDHCNLVPTICNLHRLVIADSIEDIICNFKLESIDYTNYDDNKYSHVLPDAIRSCIKKGLVVNENPTKQLVKSLK